MEMHSGITYMLAILAKPNSRNKTVINEDEDFEDSTDVLDGRIFSGHVSDDDTWQEETWRNDKLYCDICQNWTKDPGLQLKVEREEVQNMGSFRSHRIVWIPSQ